MKFINFYTGVALMLIVSLAGSLGIATGELAPPLIIGALLLAVLVMGWAGAASEAVIEVDRLKCIMHNQNADAQHRAAEAAKHNAEIVRQRRLIESIQIDNATWRAGCDTYIRRIDELVDTNDKLKERINAYEIATVVWPRKPFAIVCGRNPENDDIQLAVFDGMNYMYSDGSCFDRSGDTLDGFLTIFYSRDDLEKILIKADRDVLALSDARDIAAGRIAALEGMLMAIPRTPEEMVAFVGSNFGCRIERGPESDWRFSLSVHDLLSAFTWAGLDDDALVAAGIPARLPAPPVDRLVCTNDTPAGEPEQAGYLGAADQSQTRMDAQDGAATQQPVLSPQTCPLMHDEACCDRAQCWKECGDLGKCTPPPGWKLAPIKPTPDMIQAAWSCGNRLHGTPEGDDPLPGHQYRAMLSAAPMAPVQADTGIPASLQTTGNPAISPHAGGSAAPEVGALTRYTETVGYCNGETWPEMEADAAGEYVRCADVIAILVAASKPMAPVDLIKIPKSTESEK